MEQTKPVLHGYWRSGCSWRLRIVMNVKKIEYAQEYVHLVNNGGEQNKPEYKAMNPACMVPTLVMDGHNLTESMAICEYLEEKFTDVKMYPEDAYDKLQVRRLCEIINSGTQPIQNLGVLVRVAEFGGDKKAWAQATIQKGLDTYEAFIS